MLYFDFMENTPYDISSLADLVSYDPETGIILWKERREHHFCAKHPASQAKRWNNRFAGQPAFTTVSGGGYLTTTIMSRRAMAHRVAWCVYNKKSIGADMVIDHINGNKRDNRICNLRVSTATQNMQNAEKHKEGLRGAFFHKSTKKYQSSIRLHLGTYETEEDAAAAYEAIAKIIHGDFFLPNGKRPTLTRAL